MKQLSPMVLTDFYKQGHRQQYPNGTEVVCSNLTARGTRMSGVDKVVHIGTQASIQILLEGFKNEFFDKPLNQVVASFKRRLDTALGIDTPTEHVEALHKLGYLPLSFWGVPEGNLVDLRVPMVVFWNTLPEFFWVTNFVETELSCNTWPYITSATTAFHMRKLLTKAIEKTDPENLPFVEFQAHDFSYRGMFGSQAARMSGLAHLFSFKGTDTIPAIDDAEHYYDANSEEELIGTSVWATEHSVMCMGGAENEIQTFDRLITEVYPTGIVSIVSDTWNLWDVVGGEQSICAKLKDKITDREGKVVIRPDSGNPVHILCGYTSTDKAQMPREAWDKLSEYERKGVIECLWDIFGGDESSKGFKRLSGSIGAIYGDSINLINAQEIMDRLEAKGFASSNVVLGVGSFTYQGQVHPECIVTRDTHGMAIKATYGEINGVAKEIFKDPITDDGLKTSLKGLPAVYRNDEGGFFVRDQSSWEELKSSEFKEINTNGVWFNRESFDTIKTRLQTQ